jgi:hypothetical protein
VTNFVTPATDEPRKHALLIAASILAARKLSQYEGAKMVPATVPNLGRRPLGWRDSEKENDR